MADWESAEKVQKNDAGEFRAMIGGEWIPVAKAQKSDSGQYRIMRNEPALATSPAPTSQQKPESSLVSKIAANPLTRFAMAAGSPVMGAAEWLPGAAGEFFAENNRNLKNIIKEGEQAQPDWLNMAGTGADIAGTVMSPAFLKLGKAFQAAKTIPELMATGAVVGAAGGATTPLGTSDLRSKMEATGMGSAVGSVANPAVAGVVRGVGNMFAPMFSKNAADRGAARIMGKASGDDAPLIAATLASGTRESPFETAAQTIAPMVRPQVSALQKEWSDRLPQDFVRNEAIQEAFRKAGVKQLGIDTEPARSSAMAGANRMTQAITGTGQKATQYADDAERAVQDVRRLERAGSMAQGYDIAGVPTLGAGQRPVIGTGLTQASSLAKTADKGMDAAAEESLKAGAKARVAENLLGTWEQRGLKPLTAENIIGHINSVKLETGNKSNDTLRLVLTRLEKALDRAKNPDGTIPVEELYTMRKTGISDTIDRMAGENKDLAKRLSAGELGDIKKYLDDAIEKAGGKGWKKYLSDYATARGKIESPLERMEASKLMESKGIPEVMRILNENRLTAPGLIDKAVSITNAALRATEGVAGEHVNRAGARLMLPEGSQNLGRLMQRQQANPYGLLGDLTRNQGGLTNLQTGLLFQGSNKE